MAPLNGSRTDTLQPPIDHAAFRSTWGAEPVDSATLLFEYAKSNNKDLLALKIALEKFHLQDIMDHAHRIAGASQIVGALGVVDCCRELEAAARDNEWRAITNKVEALRREIGRVHTYISSIQAA